MTSFNFTSVKATFPNTVKMRLRSQHMNFWVGIKFNLLPFHVHITSTCTLHDIFYSTERIKVQAVQVKEVIKVLSQTRRVKTWPGSSWPMTKAVLPEQMGREREAAQDSVSLSVCSVVMGHTQEELEHENSMPHIHLTTIHIFQGNHFQQCTVTKMNGEKTD